MPAKSSPATLNDLAIRNIRRLRRIRGWSTEELSTRLDAVGCPVSRSVIALRESRRNPSRITVDELFAFATVFGVPVTDLVSEESQCGRCAGSPPAGFTCNACGEAG